MGGRVLMVAYSFPPSGSVASHRAFKFAHYLPEFGWEPRVVSRRPDRRQPLDFSFLGRAPVVRLNPIEPARLLGRLPRSWVDRFRRFFCIPDEEMGWMAALAARLPELLRRFQAHVLWANSVPLNSLVAAAYAAGRAARPLVADFHNEWTRNMYYRPATRWHDAAHQALEAFVIRRAAAVTTLNPMHTEDLRARFPGIACETIENGFDLADYDVAPPSSRAPIVLTYAGAVYGYQSPMPFLRALAETGRKDVEVRIVGDRFGQFEGGAWPFKVVVQGHQPHRELGKVFSETSAFFLCLDPPAARQLPAKLYEYLRAGRPTFAIVPKGGAADLWLRQTGAGTSVPSGEPATWAPALRDFLEGISRFRPPAADPFHRRELTRRLARVLDSAKERRYDATRPV